MIYGIERDRGAAQKEHKEPVSLAVDPAESALAQLTGSAAVPTLRQSMFVTSSSGRAVQHRVP